METYMLSNSVRIPCIGYGTGVINFPSRKQTIKQMRRDLSEIHLLSGLRDLGFSLIDTSDSYGKSHNYIGRTIEHCRSDFFICTKISNKAQLNNSIEQSFEKMLVDLKTDYIDLLLLHWPVSGVYLESWGTIEKLYNENKARAIGVANCNIHHIEALLNKCNIPPMVNQIECHPLFTQNELRDYCRQHNIQVMSYTPTGRMDSRLNISCLKDIASKYGKSTTQVILRWQYQLGNIPIINTSNKAHLKDNVNIFDFELSDEEKNNISAININSRLRYDPDNCDFTKL